MVINSRNYNFISTDKPMLGGWPVNLISYLQKIKILVEHVTFLSQFYCSYIVQ